MRKSVVEAHKIPLPPLDIQHQIVAEIEGYQKLIEEHRKAIDELDQQIKQTVNKVWGS